MIRKLTFAVLLLVASLLAGTALALVAMAQEGSPGAPAAEVILTDETGEYILGRHLEILKDPGGHLTIEDVTSPQYAAQFVPTGHELPNYGITGSAVWVRFRARSQTQDVDTWLLELGDGRMGFIDLYYPDSEGEGWVHKHAGRLLPFDAREVFHHHYVFSLPMPDGQEQTVYLRLESNTAMHFPLTLRSPEAFAQHVQGELLTLGLFYGAMLAMIMYNLVLFLSLRDLSYLYYVLIIACSSLAQASKDGISHQYLWPAAANRYGIEVFGYLTIVFLLNLATEFLQTKRTVPRLHKVMNLWMLLGGFVVLLTPFVWRINVAVNLYVLSSALLILAASVLAIRRGFVAARLFLVVFASVLLVTVIQVLTNLGLLPGNLTATKGYYLGFALFAGLLALALADRINVSRRELQQANRELGISELRLQQYLDAVPDGVVVRDADGRLQYVNKLARQQRYDWSAGSTGKQPDPKPGVLETLPGIPLYFRNTQERYPLERLPPVRALRGESASVDDVDYWAGERRTPLELWSSPILDDEGRVQYTITAFRDISERVKAQNKIQNQLAVEECLARVSTRLVQATDVDEAISETLADLAQLLGFDRLFLVRLRPNQGDMEMTHEWCAPGVSSLRAELQGVPQAEVPWLLGQLRSGGTLYLADPAELPAEAARERRYIEQHLRGRRCVLPVWMGGELDGFLACSSHAAVTPNLENEVQMLETVAGMLSTSLHRAQVLETLEQRVSDRTRELSSLYRVTTLTSTMQPLEVTLRRSLEVILSALGSAMGTVHLREGHGAPLRLIAEKGLPGEALDELASPLPEDPWWQEILAQDRPLVIAGEPCESPILPWACLAEVTAYLGVPIRAGGEPVGVLSVFGQSDRGPTAEEMALLTTIADQLGTAIESGRLRRSAEEARVMQERQRLARDLHDAVTQSLYSLTLFAEAASDMCQEGEIDRAHHYLERIAKMAHGALREMRTLIFQLRPSRLATEGLVGALEHRLEAVESRAGMEARLIADRGDPGLPPEVEEALYRVSQEALNNVLKHAGATEVVVALNVGDGQAELSVRDNGQGLGSKSTWESGGMGLSNIRQRVEELGGEVTFTSAQGKGTEVRASVPLAPQTESEQEV